MARRRLFRRRTSWEFVGRNSYILVTIGALVASAYAWSSILTSHAPSNSQIASIDGSPVTLSSLASIDDVPDSSTTADEETTFAGAAFIDAAFIDDSANADGRAA